MGWGQWGQGRAFPYLGRPRGCLLASSGCLPRDGERARAPRGLLALRRVPLLSLVLGAEGCDWPWGPEVGPGAPEDEVPGAANTIQSGRAMLVSLLARSSAGGTVSPAPGGPRRRAAYLGDSWKGTERAQWQGPEGHGRQAGGGGVQAGDDGGKARREKDVRGEVWNHTSHCCSDAHSPPAPQSHHAPPSTLAPPIAPPPSHSPTSCSRWFRISSPSSKFPAITATWRGARWPRQRAGSTVRSPDSSPHPCPLKP